MIADEKEGDKLKDGRMIRILFRFSEDNFGQEKRITENYGNSWKRSMCHKTLWSLNRGKKLKYLVLKFV